MHPIRFPDEEFQRRARSRQASYELERLRRNQRVFMARLLRVLIVVVIALGALTAFLVTRGVVWPSVH